MSTFDIQYFVKRKPEALSDVFYCTGYEPTKICQVSGNGGAILIVCNGMMRFTYNGYVIRTLHDLPKIGVYTDADLMRICDEILFDCNPWFELLSIQVGAYVETEIIHGDLDEAVEDAKRLLTMQLV